MDAPALERGATGARVADLQRRLDALGLSGSDPEGTFGDATLALVQAFQRSRGLPLTGRVDATTWSRLVEAGWRLGQRLLFLSTPLLRGDDVAELQTHLAQLGFNPGRIDGIFGPLLEAALADFQRNRALAPHGVLDRATLVELRRLSAFAGDRHLVTAARDLAALEEPALGPLVVCGDGALASALARRAAGPFEVRRVEDPSPEARAELANRLGAALVIAVAPDDRVVGVRLTYWASYRAHSTRGERLATAAADALARRIGERCEVAGMALPLLRETRMTTLLVEHGPLEDRILEGVADTLARVAAKVFHREG